MKVNALMMHPGDNVVTCIRPVSKGEAVVYAAGGGVETVTALADIPYCHKAAIRPIARGENVVKYGESIGEAMEDAAAGSWLSHLNIRSVPRDYASELL